MTAIGHLRSAISRHAHLADATIALAVLTATMLTTFAGRPPAMGNRTIAIGSAALACAALAGRRRRPLVVLVISAVAAEVFLSQTDGTQGTLILLAPSIAFYTVADLVERRRGRLLGGGVLGVLVAAHTLSHPAFGLLGPENLAFAALGGLAIAAGDSARHRRAHVTEVERRAERAELEGWGPVMGGSARRLGSVGRRGAVR